MKRLTRWQASGLLMAATIGAIVANGAPAVLSEESRAATGAGLSESRDGAGKNLAHVTAIVSVNLLDVEAGEMRAGQTVIVRGDKIHRIGAEGEVEVPQDAVVVQGKGQYLIPGLIDAHVHFVDAATYGKLCLAYGVTFVRDMGGDTDQVLDRREQLQRGDLVGPEMIVTGAILDGKPPVWPFSEVCETPEQGREAVEKLAKRGVDQIKVYSLLKKDVYLAIVDQARRRGIKAVGHVPESVTLEEAVAAGQDSCEHMTGFPNWIARQLQREVSPREPLKNLRAWSDLDKVDKGSLAAMLEKVRESGMTVCPTLAVFRGLTRVTDPDVKNDPQMQYVSPFMVSFWQQGQYAAASDLMRQTWTARRAMVTELYRARVPLMCGTDLANPYVFAGYSLHEEMELFEEAGVKPADVMRAATIVPAKFIGVSDRVGSIAEGKTASMVLLKKNPLEKVAHTREIIGVFARGRYYHREALDGLLAEVRQQVKGPTASHVPVSVPGRVLFAGRYVAKFNQFDAGDESFAISEDADGYHLKANNRPKGFGIPSQTTLHLDKKMKLVAAEWKQETANAATATYRVEGNQLKATAQRDGKELGTQTIEMPADAMFGGPVFSLDFLTARLTGELEIGQTRQLKYVSFGYPDWKLVVSEMTVERKEDTEVMLGEKRYPARHCVSTITTPMGNLVSETWSDSRGLALRTVAKLPFGTFSYEVDAASLTQPSGGYWDACLLGH